MGKGKLLGKGVCIGSTYDTYKPPGDQVTTVYSTIETQRVREVNAKKKTISVDFTLRMRWLDQRIKIDGERMQNRKGISLSHNAVNKIWTPDVHIRNRSSFKIHDEWYSTVNARIMTWDETNQINSKKDEQSTGVELTYEIKASVYCRFDYSKYPMDKQRCMIRLGSRSLDTEFKLYDREERFHRTSNYREVNFNITVDFLELPIEGSSLIGMQIQMTRLRNSYLMEYYIPCIGMILVSEIGFVVPVTAIPGRIGLLVTQFLTLINLFIHQMVIYCDIFFHYYTYIHKFIYNDTITYKNLKT